MLNKHLPFLWFVKYRISLFNNWFEFLNSVWTFSISESFSPKNTEYCEFWIILEASSVVELVTVKSPGFCVVKIIPALNLRTVFVIWTIYFKIEGLSGSTYKWASSTITAQNLIVSSICFAFINLILFLAKNSLFKNSLCIQLLKTISLTKFNKHIVPSFAPILSAPLIRFWVLKTTKSLSRLILVYPLNNSWYLPLFSNRKVRFSPKSSKIAFLTIEFFKWSVLDLDI